MTRMLFARQKASGSISVLLGISIVFMLLHPAILKLVIFVTVLWMGLAQFRGENGGFVSGELSKGYHVCG